MSQTRSSKAGRSSAGPKIPDIKSAVNEIKGSVAQPFALPRRPQNDAQAERLYYHIRTLCYWLDAASTIIKIPGLDKLPFTFGVEAIIGGLIPVAGKLYARGMMEVVEFTSKLTVFLLRRHRRRSAGTIRGTTLHAVRIAYSYSLEDVYKLSHRSCRVSQAKQSLRKVQCKRTEG